MWDCNLGLFAPARMETDVHCCKFHLRLRTVWAQGVPPPVNELVRLAGQLTVQDRRGSIGILPERDRRDVSLTPTGKFQGPREVVLSIVVESVIEIEIDRLTVRLGKGVAIRPAQAV